MNKSDKDITLDEIIEARNKLATIISETKKGNVYLPIFERLEYEIQLRHNEEALMSKVNEIAHYQKISRQNSYKSDTLIGTQIGTQE